MAPSPQLQYLFIQLASPLPGRRAVNDRGRARSKLRIRSSMGVPTSSYLTDWASTLPTACHSDDHTLVSWLRQLARSLPNTVADPKP
jgi:hypothetical protein